MSTYEYFVFEVSYKYQFEPDKSRDFNRKEEAEYFAKSMRAKGWDAVIFDNVKRIGTS